MEGKKHITDVAFVIHSEVAKYVDREFSDCEDFTSELAIPSDDLSAIALSLEKRFGVKIERWRYRHVSNVDEYANLVSKFLSK